MEFARSSPARLLAIGAALVLLCLTTGVVTAADTTRQHETLTVLLDDSEPFLHSTGNLYHALSTADAAAATAFLFGGLEPKTVRDAYTRAVRDAAAELTDDADVGATPADRALRRDIAARIPVYSGLVATARAEDRAGHPVGAAYLGEGSHLMQSTMLPMAQDLHRRESALVADTLRTANSPPWVAMGLTLTTLIALVAAQRYLARHWRRQFNAGLIAATAGIAVLGVWAAVAGTMSAVDAQDALDRGMSPMDLLSESRILVQQARTAETLKLVRHDTSTEYDRAFDTAVQRLDGILADFPRGAPGGVDVAAAQDALPRWLAAHRQIINSVGAGDFRAAAQVAVGPGSDDAPAHFRAVDEALARSLTTTRAELRGQVRTGAAAPELLPTGATLLSVAAALAVAIGLWPRLREYR